MKKAMFILIGIAIGIVGSCYAAYKLTASQVSFDKSKTDLNSENVQDSIDEITDLVKYGDAEEGDIASGKTALVKGKKVTGTKKGNLKKISKSGSVSNFYKDNTPTRRTTIKINFSDIDNYKELTIDNFSSPNFHVYLDGTGIWGGIIFESMSYNSSTGEISFVVFYDTTGIDKSKADITVTVDCFYLE